MEAVAEREVTASQDRGALAKMVMTLLDHWKLSTEDQAALFDLPPSCRTKVMQKVFMFLKAENSDTSCGHVVGIDIS